MKTWCVPTRSEETTLQSKAVSGFTTRGAPVSIAVQSAPSNLLSAGMRPAKRSEMSDWSSARMFAQKQPFSMIFAAAGDMWWTQTSMVGPPPSPSPSAETEDMAETVTPARPAGPSVVTTFTVAAARDMP